MLAKVLVLGLAAVVLCEEHGYTFLKDREPTQEYGYHYKHIPVRHQEEHAPSHETHYRAPEEHGHVYTSQSILNHAGLSANAGSQESSEEHVAPVYQYVHESEEVSQHQAAPVNHYHSPQYRPHELHVGKPPVQHAHAVHYPQSHESHSFNHGSLHSHAPVESHGHISHDEPIDYYAYPKYQYEYKIDDPHTGDNKFHHEYRDGDVVKGVYSLTEADGSIRTVEYTSDKHHGFNAIVKHSAPGQHVHIESHHNN